MGRIDPVAGPFQRHSYRDVPAAGPACLVLLPGRRRAAPGGSPVAANPDDHAPEVRAAVIEVSAGAEVFVQVRRGEWEAGHAADGLSWEGPTAALVAAIAATLEDLAWFQVGLPI